MEKFKAYRIFEENGKGKGRLTEMTLDELDASAVVIKTAYRSEERRVGKECRL